MISNNNSIAWLWIDSRSEMLMIGQETDVEGDKKKLLVLTSCAAWKDSGYLCRWFV